LLTPTKPPNATRMYPAGMPGTCTQPVPELLEAISATPSFPGTLQLSTVKGVQAACPCGWRCKRPSEARGLRAHARLDVGASGVCQATTLLGAATSAPIGFAGAVALILAR